MDLWLVYLISGMFIGLIVSIILRLIYKPINCPKCDNPPPKFRIPKNLMQWLGNGWTCDKCGCEIDRKGNEITNKEEHLKKLKKFNLKLLIIAIIFIAIFLLGSYFFIDYSITPYKYSTNPDICEKHYSDIYLKDMCLFQMAKKNNDISICKKLSGFTSYSPDVCNILLSKNNTGE